MSTDFDEATAAGVVSPSSVAQWLSKAFSSGSEIVLDLSCTGKVQIATGKPYYEIPLELTTIVKEIFAVASSHPSWSWLDILTWYETKGGPDAYRIVAERDIKKMLEANGQKLPKSFNVTDVRCKAKPRYTPPPTPTTPGNCPLSEDGCPDNPDVPDDEEIPTPGEEGPYGVLATRRAGRA
jgi:hypothetical protein